MTKTEFLNQIDKLLPNGAKILTDGIKRGTEARNGRFICSTVSYITQLAKRM